MWFTENFARRIGRLTPVCSATQMGTVTEWTASASGARPWGLTAGTGDQIWFTLGAPDRLGVITPAGPFLEVVLPSDAHPTHIVKHPNGSVWFSETRLNRVGRWQDNTLAHFALSPDGAPVGLTVDQRAGNLWIAHMDEVIRMDANGEILSVIPAGEGAGLHGVMAANDAIWLSGELSDRIGRIKL